MRWWTTWAVALRDIVGFGERLQTTWGEVELYKEWCCEIGLTTLASYWAIFPPDQATSISRGDNQVFNFEASNSKSKSNSYPLGWTILRQIFIFCSTLRELLRVSNAPDQKRRNDQVFTLEEDLNFLSDRSRQLEPNCKTRIISSPDHPDPFQINFRSKITL